MLLQYRILGDRGRIEHLRVFSKKRIDRKRKDETEVNGKSWLARSFFLKGVREFK